MNGQIVKRLRSGLILVAMTCAAGLPTLHADEIVGGSIAKALLDGRLPDDFEFKMVQRPVTGLAGLHHFAMPKAEPAPSSQGERAVWHLRSAFSEFGGLFLQGITQHRWLLRAIVLVVIIAASFRR